MRPEPLQELWSSQEINNTEDKETLMNSIQLILAQDQAIQEKQRRFNLWMAPVQLVILLLVFLCVAHGRTPIVRAGYALMAVGLTILLSVIWLFESWSRKALPGPVDTRSQLQKAAFLLSRQASLAKTSALWVAPVFLGGGSDRGCGRVSQERGHFQGYVLWVPLALLWMGGLIVGRNKAKAADEKRARMEELLQDLG